MNSIEFILANSMYSIDQFGTEQISTLNEMASNGISAEQVGIIAHPSVSALTYSVLYEYLNKGNKITSQEYQKYLFIDPNRVNDIIVNVYLGKLHGLSEEQINLYSKPSIFNIKIARLLVEHAKDASPEQLNKLMLGKFGSSSNIGKQAIQDFINGEITLDALLILSDCSNLYADEYEYIKKNYKDSRIVKIILSFYKTDSKNSFIKDDYFQQCVAITDVDEYQTLPRIIYNEIDNTYVHFDSLATYKKLCDIYSQIRMQTSYPSALYKFYSYYNNLITNNNKFINTEFKYDLYYLDSDSNSTIKKRSCNDIIYLYFNNSLMAVSKKISYADVFLTFDEYLDAYITTKGFEEYCRALKQGFSKEQLDMVKIGSSISLVNLIDLYKTEKDKLEIPYLTDKLKDVRESYIDEVICMKQNGCSNDEIHYFIENYLRAGEATPKEYFSKRYNYDKYWTITEWLDLNKLNTDTHRLYRLKAAKCSDDEINLYLNTKLWMDSSNRPVQKKILEMFLDFGINNIQYAKYYYVDPYEDKTQIILDNYKYAKSVFKDKPKCIGLYIDIESKPRIPEYLVKYIDNFTDDQLRKILDTSTVYTNFALRMSNLTTNENDIDSLYKNITLDEARAFNASEEKVTADLVVKFCNKHEIEIPDFIKDQIPEAIDTAIEKSIDYFGSSKNFKPIKYDDETIYVDIIGNKALKGSHIITFNKEENDEYEYIFEIAHEEDNLTYSAKITTKQDIKDCVTKSIALIENISEYSEYVTELQELLKTI